MADIGKTLTTGEFSQKTGIAVSTITRMLRKGIINGEKRSGKWAIFESALKNTTVVAKKDRGKSSACLGPIFDKPASAGKSYDVETFIQMTYLTDKGVRRWLETGRLSGSIDTDGRVMVDATNLDRPELQHLVRK